MEVINNAVKMYQMKLGLIPNHDFNNIVLNSFVRVPYLLIVCILCIYFYTLTFYSCVYASISLIFVALSEYRRSSQVDDVYPIFQTFSLIKDNIPSRLTTVAHLGGLLFLGL
jgi:hypothetical protein